MCNAIKNQKNGVNLTAKFKLFMCLLFLWLFVMPVHTKDKEEEFEKIDVKMKLGMTIDQVIGINPELEARTRVRPAEKGILGIKGPLTFHFLYEDEQIDFDPVKMVIYPVKDYKVDYIHIYPLMDYVRKDDMYSSLSSITKKLIGKGWKVHYKPGSENFDDELVALGQKDYTYFRYHLENPLNGFTELEFVLTAFRDLLVPCASSGSSKNNESTCRNRSIRFGLYGVNPK